MDRVKYKEEAKKRIERNKWYLWKPLVMFTLTMVVLIAAISLLIAVPLVLAKIEDGTINTITSVVGGILGTLFGYVETVFMFGYTKYCLDFVRGKEADWRDPIKYVKDHFIPALLVSLLFGLMVLGGTILLIVPGIIIAIGHIFIQEVFVDNPGLKTMEVIKKSWATTYGHKMDLFILSLSFLGWIILMPFTLCILAIWLVPYMTITFLLVYEDLTKGSKKEAKKEVIVEAKVEEKKPVKEAKSTSKKTSNKKKKN